MIITSLSGSSSNGGAPAPSLTQAIIGVNIPSGMPAATITVGSTSVTYDGSNYSAGWYWYYITPGTITCSVQWTGSAIYVGYNTSQTFTTIAGSIYLFNIGKVNDGDIFVYSYPGVTKTIIVNANLSSYDLCLIGGGGSGASGGSTSGRSRGASGGAGGAAGTMLNYYSLTSSNYTITTGGVATSTICSLGYTASGGTSGGGAGSNTAGADGSYAFNDSSLGTNYQYCGGGGGGGYSSYDCTQYYVGSGGAGGAGGGGHGGSGVYASTGGSGGAATKYGAGGGGGGATSNGGSGGSGGSGYAGAFLFRVHV